MNEIIVRQEKRGMSPYVMGRKIKRKLKRFLQDMPGDYVPNKYTKYYPSYHLFRTNLTELLEHRVHRWTEGASYSTLSHAFDLSNTNMDEMLNYIFEYTPVGTPNKWIHND